MDLSELWARRREWLRGGSSGTEREREVDGTGVRNDDDGAC